MARKRVLITGAAGYLSRQLLPVFRERYDPRVAQFETIHPFTDGNGDRYIDTLDNGWSARKAGSTRLRLTDTTHRRGRT